jgi:cystathionine gamma-synthase
MEEKSMTSDDRPLDPATLAVRGGVHHRPGDEVAPAIHLSSTFVLPGAAGPGGFSYARSGSPANEPLERVISQLECAADAIAFNAGIAAANAVLEEAEPGTAVVMPEDAYYGIRVQAEQVMSQKGIELRFVDQTDLDAVDSALRGASLMWAETPTNPLLAIADLEALGTLARKYGVPWLVDNTFATPLLQHPIEFGALGSMHSVTKYIAGHSDLILGAVVTDSPEFAARLRKRRNGSGTQADGFSLWLARRGAQTLPLRVTRQCETAQELAARLVSDVRIERVYYPGLPNHPGHDTAARQMRGRFGGVLSILVKGGETAAQQMIERCEIWVPATSLGGVESLIERRARWAGEAAPPHLVRLSAGLESVDDLWDDLDQALR